MKQEYVLAIFLIFLIILIFYFVTAKGERKRITLINSEGSEIPVDVELADNFTTRAKGLMGRKYLGENEGMLFVFEKPGIYPFWMLNTTIPLDAIFISEDFKVVEVIEMEPCGLNIFNCRLHTPKNKAKYVLEVNKGFSRKNSVSVNSTVILHLK